MRRLTFRRRVTAPLIRRAALGSADERDALALYFRDAAKLPLLRPRQEREFARRIERLERELWTELLALPAVRERVRELTQLKSLTPAAVIRFDRDSEVLHRVLAEWPSLNARVPTKRAAAIRAAAAALRREKGAFAHANLRLVISVAKRYNRGRLPLADLIQEGNVGLLKAIERYDWRRGYRFSTYAIWWIRHAIARAVADKGREVRLPVHVLEKTLHVAKARRRLAAELGRQPTVEELGAAAAVTPDKLDRLATYAADGFVSLDKPLRDDDEGRRLGDLLRDANADESTPIDRLVGEAMRNELARQLRRLRPIEADILKRRFGLVDDEERTLKEIGAIHNLSRERIRQIEEQALGKLRRAMERRGFAS